MTFDSYYSSSMGNLYTVTAANGKRLLIECGVPWAKLEKALGFNLRGIEACLLTHEHNDHSKAFKNVMQAGINIFASAGTWEALSNGLQRVWRRARIVANESIVHTESFDILAFKVVHDAAEPLGYVVREKATEELLLFVTDTALLEQRFIYQFSIIAIGCSYDNDILAERVERNEINETLAKRLLTSHPEKSWVIRYLKDYCDLSKCREIILLHCSGENLDRQAACKEIEGKLLIKTR